MKKIILSCVPFFPKINFFYKKIIFYKKMGIENLELCLPDNNSLLDGKYMLDAYKISIKNGFSINCLNKILNFILKRKFKKVFIMFSYKYLLDRKFVSIIENYKFNYFFYIIPDIDKNDNFYIKNKKKIFLIIKSNNLVKNDNKKLFYVLNGLSSGKKNNNLDLFINNVIKKKNNSIKIVGFGIFDFLTILKLYKIFNYVIIGSGILKMFYNKKPFTKLKKYLTNVKNKINKIR